MGDDDEIGRPNYVRGGTAPQASRPPARGAGPGPAQASDIGAWIALAAACVSGLSLVNSVGIPLMAGLVAALLAIRLGLRGRAAAVSSAAYTAANAAWIGGLLFAIPMVGIVAYFFEYNGFTAALNMMLG